jgi:chromosome segregation ATPase
MSGETAKAESGWTTDTLKIHLQHQIDDLRKLLDERYDTQTKAVDAAFAAAAKAVDTALGSAEKAVEKAERAANARFESVNEFRAQLADQAQTFMPRLEAEQRLGQVSESLSEVKSRLDLNAGSSSGADKFRASLIALAGAAVGIVGLVAALITRS